MSMLNFPPLHSEAKRPVFRLKIPSIQNDMLHFKTCRLEVIAILSKFLFILAHRVVYEIMLTDGILFPVKER